MARYSLSLRALLLAVLLPLLAIPPGILRAAQEKGPMKPPATQEPATAPQQGKPAAPAQPKPQYSISVESTLVDVNVVVTDQKGDILTGLKKDNFRVFEDGVPQTITNFAPTDAPITIVIVMEFSQIAYNFFYYSGTGDPAYWSYEFLNNLGPKDYVALVTFDLRTHIEDDFTQDKREVQDTLAHLYIPSFHESNLFDAVYETVDRLQDVRGKKAILLLATGIDTFSKHTLGQTYNRLKSTDVTIFSIGVAENFFTTYGESIGYLQARNQLNTFAQLTGGYAWFPRFDGELPSIFHSVTAFLRNEYSLGYAPSNTAHNGKYRKIKVEVVDADGQPLMIPNKKGKKQKVVVYAREGYLAPKGAVGD
jgi:VWFA-related protein